MLFFTGKECVFNRCILLFLAQLYISRVTVKWLSRHFCFLRVSPVKVQSRWCGIENDTVNAMFAANANLEHGFVAFYAANGWVFIASRRQKNLPIDL